MRILVIDIGGTNLKVSAPGFAPLKIPSGREMTPDIMVRAVHQETPGSLYDLVSIGYPGPVKRGRPVREPNNLSPGWIDFDYEMAFAKPVRMVNDAAMQALGSYQGGELLFLGLGTGLGAALVENGMLVPLELADLPYRNGRSYEDYLGTRGLERLGRRKWTRHVERVVELFRFALQADDVALGGGQTRQLTRVLDRVRIVPNSNAIIGGYRLWETPHPEVITRHLPFPPPRG
jgi:predicted NBD/HSP70 family sugar kinase